MNLDKYYLKLVKRYFLYLFILFMFYSIFIFLYFKDIPISIFLISVSLLYLLILCIENKTNSFIKFLKSVNIFTFIILTLITSFFYLYTHKQAGVEFFYLCIIFSLPLFFDFKKHLFSILFLASLVFFSFTVCLLFDCEFIARSHFFKTQKDFKLLKLINFFFLLLTFFIDILFIAQKNVLISNLIENDISKRSTIEILTRTNKKLSSQINNFTINESDFQYVYNLAKNNSPIFMEKFNALFPHFKSDLLNICPALIDSDLHFCALIKLGLDGQQISVYNNCSKRSVDSKKYRLRKKLNIDSKASLREFMEQLQNDTCA